MMSYRLTTNAMRHYPLIRSFVTPRVCSWYATAVRHMCYDPEGKTVVRILNRQVDKWLMIDSYSQVGFRLNNGLFVLGPLAIFPRSVFSWNVGGADDVNEDSLSLFLNLEPKLDMLVLGVGDNAGSPNLKNSLFSIMAKYKINFEVLTTDQACATYNFLNAENRHVAAALIPPATLKVSDDDVIDSKKRHKKLYGTDDFEEQVERQHIK